MHDLKRLLNMCGSAKREPLQNLHSCKLDDEANVQASNEIIFKISRNRQDFANLQIPRSKAFYKKLYKDNLISKSCKDLFECLKPYKDIMKSRKTVKKNYGQGFRSALKETSGFIKKKNETRKLQYLSIFEETHDSQLFFTKYNFSASVAPPTETETKCLDLTFTTTLKKSDLCCEMKVDLNSKTQVNRKTITSQDFIKDALSTVEASVPYEFPPIQ